MSLDGATEHEWVRITHDVCNDITAAVNHLLANAEIVDVPDEGTLQEKLAAMTSAMAALSFRWRGDRNSNIPGTTALAWAALRPPTSTRS